MLNLLHQCPWQVPWQGIKLKSGELVWAMMKFSYGTSKAIVSLFGLFFGRFVPSLGYTVSSRAIGHWTGDGW